MTLHRTVLALAAFWSLTTVAPAAPLKGTKATPAAKPHHHHHLNGVVVAVHHDKATGNREIKVKVHHHHHKKTAKTAAAAATTKKKHHHGVVTVHVTSSTKFAKVVKSQGKVHRHKAHFAEVHKGQHVHITLTAHHHAKHVDIVSHHQSKKSPPLTTRKPSTKSKKPQ